MHTCTGTAALDTPVAIEVCRSSKGGVSANDRENVRQPSKAIHIRALMNRKACKPHTILGAAGVHLPRRCSSISADRGVQHKLNKREHGETVSYARFVHYFVGAFSQW